MNNIIYVSATVPESLYKKQIPLNDKTDQQGQKFNRSVMKGFVENGFTVHAVCYRKNIVADKSNFKENGINWHILNCKNNKTAFIKSIREIRKLLKSYNDIYVFCDVLNMSVVAGAIIATKGRNCIGIVTDVPGIYNDGFNAYINRFFIKQYAGYVFLTQAMNSILNPHNKPYCVMEGLYEDFGKTENSYEKNNQKFKIIYAGSLHKQYGIDKLLKAIHSIKDDDIELHLYGAGDYVDNILKLEDNKSLFYHGVKDNNDVIEAEKKVDLLINPRSKNELFTQYSFPSKTIEYMATGTPVLMQKLPGMPDEYCDYVFLYEEDTEESLKNAIINIKNMPQEFLGQKGMAAKQFILEKKNAKMQINNIIKSFGI